MPFPPTEPVRFSRHAATRLQQRGIPAWFVQLLVEHGKSLHDGHGALVKSVDHGTRRRLQALLPREQYARAERYFGVYAVVAASGSLITAAHRTGRHFH